MSKGKIIVTRIMRSSETFGGQVPPHKPKDWHPQERAVCMATDAFRLALGMKPRNFTAKQVIALLRSLEQEKR